MTRVLEVSQSTNGTGGVKTQVCLVTSLVLFRVISWIAFLEPYQEIHDITRIRNGRKSKFCHSLGVGGIATYADTNSDSGLFRNSVGAMILPAIADAATT
jgi:hypothetical protein